MSTGERHLGGSDATVLTETKRMKAIIVTFCLIGTIFANPILYSVILEPNGIGTNMTESLSSSQSSESDTSELQSPEENSSNQSSESESSENTLEDKTSEENDSQSVEDGADSMAETRDNSMSSEENIRKSWVQLFPSVIGVLSAEDNSSTEVKGQSDPLSIELTAKLPTQTSTNTIFRLRVHTNQAEVGSPTDINDTSSDSTDTSDFTGVKAATSESSSSESNETSEASDSSDASKSTEDSNTSDSTELEQIKARDCQQGADSTDCESEEYFLQDIGDDAHHSVDDLMVPEEEHRELNLQR
ncbi:hypothetical protein LDENG_00193650 [Lucifuga dentata]|nr:hypothetical protein LDENG_00193650 [Lucifuga dentata]